MKELRHDNRFVGEDRDMDDKKRRDLEDVVKEEGRPTGTAAR